MEAPEKIKIGKHNITSDGDVVFGWVTNEPDCEAMQHDIEYIRTDAFIEKALEYIENNIYNHYDGDNEYGVCGGFIKKEEFIDGFKNFMKK